ncbi:MAG: ribosomal protein S18-alanine N-acetyltransferase [Clostridia bacterium]
MYKINLLNASHIDKMFEIERLCFKTPWSKAMLENELKNPLAHYFCIENERELVAYIGFYRILDEAHITNLAVLPSEQGKGLAKKLLKYTIDVAKAQGIKDMTLEVNERNEKAIKLYESFGFELAGKRPKYYEGVDAALIYWLRF